jgi:hypothetical protein
MGYKRPSRIHSRTEALSFKGHSGGWSRYSNLLEIPRAPCPTEEIMILYYSSKTNRQRDIDV